MSSFAFLAAEFPAVHEAAVEAERQAAVSPTAAAFFAGKAVEVAVSPGSARISATFSPGRSGRTAVSCLAMMMPEASTIEAKQDFTALSTVTAAPFGASGSSAAREGDNAARAGRAAAKGVGSMRELARQAK